ncbi:alpha/beta hydrolase [Pontibacter diazotrophicus]|uniref:Alpha/beta hydrolase n=1 Tax=Pontibacter diazotrophicus TaxID=1400979 RepID=A0A3D8L6N8_9BACT|nr:alpha/beta hydrolase [Pontibacter diazotrophicus]RDV13064.1 alpha/beta hydrolase [Pontibacter diazotrophicus]
MENLLLLHGALGAASTMEPLANALQERFKVHTLDFTGHGGRPLPQEPFSMQLFVQDILRLLEEKEISSTHIFGYSMGGYAALSLAQQHPQCVKSVFTLATKFSWSPETAAKEIKLLNPEKIAEKVPAFAQALATRHHPQDWKQVMHKTAEMMLYLGEQPDLTSDVLPQIQVPVHLAVGDQDNMVSVEETLWAYRQLPKAQLQVLPATRHPLEAVSVDKLNQEIRQFISQATVSI